MKTANDLQTNDFSEKKYWQVSEDYLIWAVGYSEKHFWYNFWLVQNVTVKELQKLEVHLVHTGTNFG